MNRAALGVGAALALALGGCANRDYLPVNGSGAHTAVVGSPDAAPPAPPPHAVAAQGAAQGGSAAGDQCGAAPLQYLVGKSKDEIPVALVPSRRRVVCTTCPATMDMRPDRQTIRYDEATKKVVSVTCG